MATRSLKNKKAQNKTEDSKQIEQHLNGHVATRGGAKTGLKKTDPYIGVPLTSPRCAACCGGI